MSVIFEPTAADWAKAGDLWDALEKMDRVKARTIVTSALTSSPEAVEATRNWVREYVKDF